MAALRSILVASNTITLATNDVNHMYTTIFSLVRAALVKPSLFPFLLLFNFSQ